MGYSTLHGRSTEIFHRGVLYMGFGVFFYFTVLYRAESYGCLKFYIPVKLANRESMKDRGRLEIVEMFGEQAKPEQFMRFAETHKYLSF